MDNNVVDTQKQKKKEYNQKWREGHREYIKEKTRIYRLIHSRKEEGKKYYWTHRASEVIRRKKRYHKDLDESRRLGREYYKLHHDIIRGQAKLLNEKLKIEVLTYYGNGRLACKRCEETNLDVLCIDHINGNGAKHRREIQHNTYQWLKYHKYPEGYQTLCANCNYIKRFENKEYRPINKYLSDNDNKVIKERERLKIFRQVQKQDILTYYGNGKCACVKCGFDDIRALTIDHIDGGGAEHRRQTERTMYRWLKRNGYPEGYQTLCMNCNFIKKMEEREFSKKIKSMLAEVKV